MLLVERLCYWVAVVALAALLSACAKLDSDPASDTENDTGTKTQSSSSPLAANREETSVAGNGAMEGPVYVHRWSSRMRPQQIVRILNDYGDIQIKNSADSGLNFAGAVQKLNDEQREPEFGTDKFAGGLALVVRAPEHWNGRVDAGVRVPKSAPLESNSTSGLIRIRVGDNPVTASSISGQLALRSAGTIIANSHSGSIRATYEGTQYQGEAGALHSVSGNIDVWLRPDASLQIVVTAASVTNNIPASLSGSERDASGATVVKLGDGAASLRVTTEQGAVTLNVLPVPVRRRNE